MQKDRLTFEEACKELQISEEEMEQLVANGEIASIKEGEAFFFKREVLAQFKKSRKTEPTIILADEDMEILEGMEEIDLGAPAKPAAKPAAKPSPAKPVEPTPVTDDALALDDIVIEPRGGSPKAPGKGEPTPAAGPAGTPDETVLNLEGLLEDDGSEGTTPIPGADSVKMLEESADITVEGNVSDETLLDTDLLEIGEEEDSFKLDSSAAESIAEPTEANLLRGGGARAMQMKRKKSHAPWTIALVLTAILLFLPLGVSMNTFFVTREAQAGPAPIDTKGKSEPAYKWVMEYNLLGGMIEGISDLFRGSGR